MLVLEEKAGAGVDAGDNIILRPYIQSRVNNRNYTCFIPTASLQFLIIT